MGSRFVVYAPDIAPRQEPGSPVRVRPVLTESFGCTYLTETVLSIDAGTTSSYESGDHEELLFVLAGSGHLVVGDGPAQEFGPESGIYIGRGETYQLQITEAAEIVSVRVADPAGDDVPAGDRRTVSPLDAQEVGKATAGREYRVLANPSTGFRSGTHFVGDVPTGELAPLHYHLYNEVIYVLKGTGILHIDGEHNPIYPGRVHPSPGAHPAPGREHRRCPDARSGGVRASRVPGRRLPAGRNQRVSRCARRPAGWCPVKDRR
ncbi:cupin domain-containing protein [Fodinicola feengrottensis]|uniref:cupin domain-containing protein n=1 Tax=Fodinicola feengrottensis TaxID=435914 RepID=UPI0013D282D6|nr:cupin domain-containing protein [Fodinicola feengrottensis]